MFAWSTLIKSMVTPTMRLPTTLKTPNLTIQHEILYKSLLSMLVSYFRALPFVVLWLSWRALVFEHRLLRGRKSLHWWWGRSGITKLFLLQWLNSPWNESNKHGLECLLFYNCLWLDNRVVYSTTQRTGVCVWINYYQWGYYFCYFHLRVFCPIDHGCGICWVAGTDGSGCGVEK